MRVLHTRFQILLRLNKVEFFQIEMNDTERTAFLLYVDERKSANSEEGNIISIYLISDFELSAPSYEDVLSFNDDLLGMKYNCSYVMEVLPVEEEFHFDFPYHMLAIQEYVQQLLVKVHTDKKLPLLEEADFNYLSQQRLK